MARFGFGMGFGSQSSAFAPLFGETAFVTTWNTENLGGTGSATKVILLPMPAGVEVDWGDGTVNNLNTHTYATGGIKTVKIAGAVTNWLFNNGGDKLKITDVSNVGGLVIDNVSMFHTCNNMTWTATDTPTITATSFFSMFRNCYLFNGNLNNWDVSGITSIGSMFRSASVYNQPMNLWDTSNITNMNAAFSVASAFDQDISSWDLSLVTTGGVMLDSSSFSQTNYDLLLPAMDAQSLVSGVSWHFGAATYGAGAPATARASLVGAPDLLVITDGGPA